MPLLGIFEFLRISMWKICFLLCITEMINGQSPRSIIRTRNSYPFAGGGTNAIADYVFGDAPATDIEIAGEIVGMAVDSQNHVFLAVPGYQMVYYVDNFGIIRVFAGTGASSSVSLGDGDDARSAALSLPSYVAVDRFDQVYISELGANRIRIVAMNGIIDTFAGSTIGDADYQDNVDRLLARFDTIRGLCFDYSFTVLYIVDSGNNVIRTVDLTTGIVNTLETVIVQGNPVVTLYQPWDVYVNSDNEVFIVNYYDTTIVRYSFFTATYDIVAGTSQSGDYACVDGDSADSCSIGTPRSITGDKNGNLYIGTNEQRIVLVKPNQTIYSYAGDGNAGELLTSDTSCIAGFVNGVLFVNSDTGGKLLFSDNGRNQVMVLYNNTHTTSDPSLSLTIVPSQYPSVKPTKFPTAVPTIIPTLKPTPALPTYSVRPSSFPSAQPSVQPSQQPSALPTSQPSRQPTSLPSVVGSFVYNYTIEVVAGTLSASSSSSTPFTDGDAATSVQFMSYPTHVYVDDSNGDMYVCDANYHYVVQVDSFGSLHLVAGVYNDDTYNGDGIVASSASLASPYSFSMDATGNKYIVENTGNRIRKIDSSNIIDTICGSIYSTPGSDGDNVPAIDALLNSPSNIFITPRNVMYIADTGNHVIRVIDLWTMIITTVVGSITSSTQIYNCPVTSASLTYPTYVYVDVTGNMFIGDSGVANRIYMVNTTGYLKSVVGNGGRGYRQGSYVGTSVPMRFPYPGASDLKGNHYLPINLHSTVAKLDSRGVLSTFAGNGDPGNQPYTAGSCFGNVPRAAWYSYPYLYVVDSTNLLVKRIYMHEDPTSQPSSQPSTPPSRVPTSQPSRQPSTTPSLSTEGFAYNYTVSVIAGNKASTAPTVLTDGDQATSINLLQFPAQLYVDDDDTIFAPDFTLNYIVKILADGAVYHVAGLRGVQGFNGDNQEARNATLTGPFAVVLDSDRNVYFTEYRGHRIRKIDAITGNITTICGYAGLTPTSGLNDDNDVEYGIYTLLKFPLGLAINQTAGLLYIADSGSYTVRVYDLATTMVQRFAGQAGIFVTNYNSFRTDATFANLFAVFLDSAGNVFVSARTSNQVFKIDSAGYVSLFAGNGNANVVLGSHRAVDVSVPRPAMGACDGPNSCFIPTVYTVTKVDAEGIQSIVVGNGVIGNSRSSLQNALGITYAVFYVRNTLYMSDSTNGVIKKMLIFDEPTSQPSKQPSQQPSRQPSSLPTAVGWYRYNYSIEVVAGNKNASLLKPFEDGDEATSIKLPYIGCLYPASDDSLYACDSNNYLIIKVTQDGRLYKAVGRRGDYRYNGDHILATNASIYNAYSFGMDTQGNQYIAELSGHRIRKVNTTGYISTICGSTAGTSVSGTSNVTFIAATSALITSPRSIFVTTTGILYFTEQSNYVIRQIDLATNTLTTFAGKIGVFGNVVDCYKQNARFGALLGVFVDSMGAMYVSDNNANRIKKIDASGYVTNFAGTGVRRYTLSGPLRATSKSIWGAYGVSCGDNGKCYLGQIFSRAIPVVDSNTGIMQTAVGNGIAGNAPYSDGPAVGNAYAVAVKGDYLYFADTTYGIIKRMFIHNDPSSMPSSQPSGHPSITPSSSPTSQPIVIPTSNPSGFARTVIPTLQPNITIVPSIAPSTTPSIVPLVAPSTTPSVVPSIAPTSTPTVSTVITSAQLSDEVVSVQVFLNQALFTSVSVGNSFPCSRVLIFANVELYNCIWRSLTTLDVVMTARDAFISVGTLMTLQNQSLALVGVEVQRPQNVVAPQAVMRVSSSVQSCLDVQIDLSSSSGSYGRAWTSGSTLSWLDINSLNTLFSVNVSTQSVLAVPKSYLTSGESYVVSVELCNVLGDCSQSAAADVRVNDEVTPIVSIGGLATRSIYVNNSLSLSSTAYTQQCDGTRSYSNLQLSWSLRSSTGSAISQTTGKSSFSIAAYSLNVTQTYTATVTALYTLSGAVSTSSVTLQVLRSSLVSSITPSGTRQVRAGDSIVLSGKRSFDPDLQSSKRDSSSFIYTWSCYRLIETIPFGVCQLNTTSPANDHSQLRIQSNLSNVDSIHRICLQVAATSSDSRSSSAFCTDVMVISAKSPLISILNDPLSVQKVSTQKRLTLQGSIWTPINCLAEWSVFNAINQEQVNASQLVSGSFKKTISESSTKRWIPVNLFVLANVLSAGQTYTFSLGCNVTSVTLSVVTNMPPQYGILSVSPSTGLELNTSFAIETALWQDSDLPLTYLFSFSPAGSSSQFSIGSRSQSSLASAVFSSGLINIIVLAYDSLNAYSTAETFAVVQQAEDVTARLNSIDGLLEDTSDASSEIFAQFASSISAALSTVSCAGANGCSNLHREECQVTADTCGSCLTGYIGELGDSNLPCLASTATLTNGIVACTSDSDCPSVFYTCGDAGVCVTKQKECLLGCSGHGYCTFIDTSFGTVLTSCAMSDTSCIAQCTCMTGFGGDRCELTSEELLRRITIKETVISSLLNGLNDLLTADDEEGTGVSGLATTVNAASTSAGSMSASAFTNAIDMIAQLFAAAASQGLSVDKVSSLLQTVDASISSNVSSSMLIKALNALDIFGSVVSMSALSIDAPQEHTGDNFRLSSVVFDPSSSLFAQLISPQSGLEQWIAKATSSVTVILNVTNVASEDSQQASINLQLLELPPKLLFSNYSSNGNGSLTSSILSVKYSNVSDLQLSFPLLSTGLDAFTSYQAMNITHRCYSDDYSRVDYTCPGNNQSLTFTCSGQAANMTKSCPSPVLRCRTVDLSTSSIQDDDRCWLEQQQITANGGLTAICRCDLSSANDANNRRRLSAESMAMTMVVLLEYVVVDFASTFDSSDALLSPSSVEKVYVVIVLYAGLWSVGLVFYLILRHLKQQKEKKKRNSVKDSAYPQLSSSDPSASRAMDHLTSAPGLQRRDHRHRQRKSTNLVVQKVDNNSGLIAREKIEQFRQTLIQYLEAVFPAVFDDHSSLVRIAQELMNNHSYLRLMFRPSKRRSMGLSIFQILTLKSSMLFLMALLYDLQSPADDGKCPTYTAEELCLQRRSIFDDKISYCLWQPSSDDALTTSTGSCAYHQTRISFQAAIYCAFVMSIFTAITTRPLEYLFALLNAPTAAQIETATALYRLQQVQHGLGDAMRRASVINGGMFSRQRSKDPLSNNDTNAAASNSSGNPDDKMMIVRDIPDRATQAQHDTRSSSIFFDPMQLKNMLLSRRTSDSAVTAPGSSVRGSLTEDIRGAESTLTVRDRLIRATSSKRIGTKNEETAAALALISLQEAILAHRSILLDDPKKLREFDIAWRLNAYTGNLRSILRQPLLKELIIVKQESTRFEEQMKRTTPEDAGVLMLQLFTRDLLGRDTPAAKIFEAKTEEDFQTVRVVSIRQKVLVTALLVGINGFFAYFSLLQGLQRGLDWQRAYLFACLLQIAAEVLFYETFEVLWVHFLLPSTVSSEVQRVHRVLRENAASFSLLAASSGAVSTGVTVALNAADFLFVSANVAKHRIESGLLEAMIVLSYHTALPGETVRKLLPRRIADQVKQEEAEQDDEDSNSSKEDEDNSGSSESGDRHHRPSWFHSSESSLSSSLWWQLQRGSVWLAAFARYTSIFAIFLLASLPFELHRVIIRFFEPFVLGGLVYTLYLVYKHPILLPIICVVVAVGLLTSMYYAYGHEVKRRRELARIAASGLEDKSLERAEEKARKELEAHELLSRRRRESSEDSTAGPLHLPKGSKNMQLEVNEEEEIVYFTEEEERKANARIESSQSGNKRRSSSRSGILLPAIKEVPASSSDESDPSSFSSKEFDSLSSENEDDDDHVVATGNRGTASRSSSIASVISDIVMNTVGNRHSRSNIYDAESEDQPLVRTANNNNNANRLRARTRSQNSQHSSPFNSYLSEDESDNGTPHLRSRVRSTSSNNGGYQKF